MIIFNYKIRIRLAHFCNFVGKYTELAGFRALAQFLNMHNP